MLSLTLSYFPCFKIRLYTIPPNSLAIFQSCVQCNSVFFRKVHEALTFLSGEGFNSMGLFSSPSTDMIHSLNGSPPCSHPSSTFQIFGADGVFVEFCEKHIIDISSLFNFLLKVWLLRGYVVCLVLGLSVYVHSWRLLCLRLQSHLLFFKARLAASRLPTISSFLGLH